MTNKLLPIFLFIFSLNTIIGQTLDAELLELKFSNDGYPEKFTKTQDGFYFTANGEELWFSNGTVQGTSLFAASIPAGDINSIFPVGDVVYFVAEMNNRTFELWVSDGTVEGTIQLTERTLSFSQDDSIRNLEVIGNKVYFSAYDETLGLELWVSDGTVEGTDVLKDINDGGESSNPSNFFSFNGYLFFKAYTEELGVELWQSDGTAEGTKLFKDINPGIKGSVDSSVGYATLGDSFYFFANNGTTGSELWKSDGTTEGTILLKDINQTSALGSSNTQMFGGAINGNLIFLANDGITGNELWISDGTEAGTKILKDIAPNGESGVPSYNTKIAFSESKVFFYAIDDTSGGLWVSDGTTEGTKFLKQVSVSNLTFDDTKESVVFFGGGSGYYNVLWKSDGTVQGTQLVSEKATATNTSAHENDIIIINGQIIFAADTERYGIELWSSDGTDEGTSLFYDLNSTYGVNPTLLTEVGDQLYFRGNESGYYVLCTSDGTIEGTKFLDINLDGQSIDEDSDFIDFNGRLVVSAHDGVHGFEPWISDGTQEGTSMILDINPGNADSLTNSPFVRSFRVVNGKLYILANDGNGMGIWVSDGTGFGTYKVTDSGITALVGNNGNPLIAGFNNDVYFFGNGASGKGLYKLDPISNSNTFVHSFAAIEQMYATNNGLFVLQYNGQASYPDSARELWVSDGTASGTVLLEKLANDRIDHATVFKNEFYFSARIFDTADHALFKSDGTAEGTYPVFMGDIPVTSYPLNKVLVACGDHLYFGVENSFGTIVQLWRTDGTVEGTIQMVSETEGVFNSITELTCFKDNLIFLQSSESKPLWLTSGKPDEMYGFDINVVNSLVTPNSIAFMTTVGNKIFFSGYSALHGDEIYVTSPLNVDAGGNLTDADNDGVLDLFDECPSTPVGEEINDVGCAQSQLDDDNDGVTNDLDQCPHTLPNEVVDEHGCSGTDLLDSDQDGVSDTLDLCPNTPTGEPVDENGCGQSQLDDDQDGIMNNLDLCPETLPIYSVDVNGCPVIFDLPPNNFSIETIGVTCVGKNNGQLLINANESHNYIARINDDEYSFTSELIVQNLYAGKYELCITIPDQPDFIKCFGFEIADASEVTGKSNTMVSNQKLVESIEMFSGTAPFTVYVNNDEKLITMAPSFTIEVEYGDVVTVTSKFPCEGVYERKISTDNGISFAPNPTNDDVFVHLPYDMVSDVQVSIYNSNLQLVKSGVLRYEDYRLKVSLQGLPSGVYYIRLTIDKTIVFKIVKR